MAELTADLAHVTAERKRLQKQAQRQRGRQRAQRERALLSATIAFCHEPTAGETIAQAALPKHAPCMDEDGDACTREIEDRFLKTPVDVLCQCLDWKGNIPPGTQAEAKRLVEDARLLSWVGDQNSMQGVAPTPQLVWETRCALSIENSNGVETGAATWRPHRSAFAKKWMQRFCRR